MKTIGIVGSRRRNTQMDYGMVLTVFMELYQDGDEIVSGGCLTGADSFAETIAKTRQIPIKIYYAPWDAMGTGAGHYRNTFIARDADVLIACVAPDRSGGTEDTVRKFQRLHAGEGLVLV